MITMCHLINYHDLEKYNDSVQKITLYFDNNGHLGFFPKSVHHSCWIFSPMMYIYLRQTVINCGSTAEVEDLVLVVQT